MEGNHIGGRSFGWKDNCMLAQGERQDPMVVEVVCACYMLSTPL